jgi:hypothetical protein
VFDAVRPRFTDPRGDHPPYSRLKIDVQPGKTQVRYGDQCEIHATTSGLPAEKLFLVTDSKEGRTESVMFRAPDGSFFQTLTNLRDDTVYFVTDGRARTLRYDIGIMLTPRITMVETHTEFPAYTGLKPHTEKMKEADVQVPARTTMQFRVASNRELASGVLEITPTMGGAKQTVKLVPTENGSKVVTGSFQVTQAVAVAITVTDVDGLVSSDVRRGRVTVLGDKRPQITVLEPRRKAIATPSVSIPVHIRSEDDYAVASVLWYRGYNQSLQRSSPMKVIPRRGPGETESFGQFDMKDLGVRPGDKIDYFFEAVDNYPDGPNTAASLPYSIDIISEEEYKKILQSMKTRQALFQQYMALTEALRRTAEKAEWLEDQLKKLEAKGGTPEEKAALAKQAAELRKAMAEYQKALAKAMQADTGFDVEKAFQGNLQDQKGKLDELMKKMDAAMQGGGVPDAKAMEEIAKALNEMAGKAAAEVGEPAQQIAAVANLLMRADIYTRLAQRQQEIADLAQRFKDQTGDLSRLQQMELQELASEQRDVRDAMQSLTEELPDMLSKLPQDSSYDDLRSDVKDFLDAAKNLAIQKDLGQASDMMTSLDGRSGYWKAKEAAEKMDQLVKRLKAGDMPGKGNAALRFSPSLSQSLGNTLAQIMAAMQGQGLSGGNGYGLYGQEMGLYGAEVELGAAGGWIGDRGSPEATSRRPETVSSDPGKDTKLTPSKGPLKVKLQHDAKFPLRFRNLVGDYFRAVAEAEGETQP